ncbi:MAG: TrkA C-terminal domain-containing protein [bacterium]
MMFGYAFTVTIMSALVNIFLSFNQSELQLVWWQLSIPLIILIVLELLCKHPAIQRYLNKHIEHIASKIMFASNTNHILLLDYIGHNAIAEVNIYKVPIEFQNVPLYKNGLRDNYGILVILIEHVGKEAENVQPNDIFYDGDKLIVCGDYNNICKAFEVNQDGIIDEEENYI